MAKVSFTKLNLKKQEDVKVISFNGQEIEVKQYLPVSEKLELIANVLNDSLDENSFNNVLKADVYADLEIIYAYTNLSFTEKQKENPDKLYDLMETNGLIEAIYTAIPEDEYRVLLDAIEKQIEAFHKYKNSALGILEAISEDYSDLNLEAENLQKNIGDGKNIEFLKEVMTKLG